MLKRMTQHLERDEEVAEGIQETGSPVLTVAAQLVAAIRDGELAPGQRLVETEFAKRLGVARTTMREALQRLEAQGLLSLERHRGFLVRAIDRRELRENYEARAALDGLASRLAAPAFRQDSRELKAIYDGLEAACVARNMQEFTRLNRAFHKLIRDTGGNQLVTGMLEKLEQSIYHYQFRLLVDGQQVFQTQEDHSKIYQALAAGDADAAEMETRAHAMRSLEQLMQLPDRLFKQD
jgi:DNA-binding GntR family transcriptional regulator